MADRISRRHEEAEQGEETEEKARLTIRQRLEKGRAPGAESTAGEEIAASAAVIR